MTVSLAARAGVLVTDVSGRVELEGKGSVALLAEIPNGGILALSSDARLVAVDLASGREFALAGAARYLVAADGLRTADGRRLEAKPLPAKSLPELRIVPGRTAQATLVMRGLPKYNVPVLHKPANTTVVTLAPLFQWGAVDDASAYRLNLQRADGASVWEHTGTATEIRLPESHPLAAGEKYRWRIEAIGADQRVIADASAQFSVAAAATIQRLRDLEPSADAPFARRVLYATQLHAAGALAEARELWRTLARERPEDEVLGELAKR